MASIFTPSSPTRRDRVPKNGDQSSFDKFFRDNFSGPSWMTAKEFDDMWVAAAKRQFSLMTRPESPSPEERMKRRQERYRKGLIIALNTYAKRNNIQLSELEIVEEKGRNQVDGSGGGLYVHSNFLVKDLDGKLTLFFAETEPDCTEEDDVILCTPLEETSHGHCYGCGHRAKELKHPSGGGYLGGLDEVFIHIPDMDSDDEYFI